VLWPAPLKFDDGAGGHSLGYHDTIVLPLRIVAKNADKPVTLRADIYRPAADGKYPVLLTRTPYNKDGFASLGQKAAARGFMLVAQDVRGRYTSEDEWYPFKHETDDGYDTVEWAAALPASNGKVGMFSGSYVGATQMLAAISHPPHLAGICPVVTASNYHENWTYQGGAFEQWFDESWTSGLAQDTYSRQIKEAANAVIGDTVLPLKNFPVFNIKTAQDGPALTRSLAPYFLDWLDHPAYDNYWKQWSIEENYQNIQVPSLTIAAWYDIFQGGALRNYLGLKAHAGNDAARNGQRLLVTIILLPMGLALVHFGGLPFNLFIILALATAAWEYCNLFCIGGYAPATLLVTAGVVVMSVVRVYFDWQVTLGALSALGLLSRFVGMLTDSRSFLSYSRHEYFRRLLCNLLGNDVEKGLVPNDMGLLGNMVRDICFRNARAYFGFWG